MASQTPYAQLTGVWKLWLAPASTAIPALDASVSGSWTEFGDTDGDQTWGVNGGLTAHYNNDHIGPVKYVRGEAGFSFAATVVTLTLEMWARALGVASSQVTTTTSGALNVKKLPLIRPHTPERFALLARGGATPTDNHMSAYGAWPAQVWVPIVNVDGDAVVTFSKTGQPGIPTTFRAVVDTTQSSGEEFGYLMMQSS